MRPMAERLRWLDESPCRPGDSPWLVRAHQTLEDDLKWLEGLILGVAGRFDGAESHEEEQ